jgi:2-epi-5-epi-valiolone synthase
MPATASPLREARNHVGADQSLDAMMAASFRIDLVPDLFDPANRTLASAWLGTRRLLVVRDAGVAERGEQLMAYLRDARQRGELDDFLDIEDLEGEHPGSFDRVVDAAVKAQLGRRDAFVAFGGEQTGRVVAIAAASFRRHTAAVRIHRDLAAVVACLRDGLRVALDGDPVSALARRTQVIIDQDGLLGPRAAQPGEDSALLLLALLDLQLVDRLAGGRPGEELSAVVRLCQRLGPGHPAWRLGEDWLRLAPREADQHGRRMWSLLFTAQVAQRLGLLGADAVRACVSLVDTPLSAVVPEVEAVDRWLGGRDAVGVLLPTAGGAAWVSVDRDALLRSGTGSTGGTRPARPPSIPDPGPRMTLGARVQLDVPVGFPVRFTERLLDPGSTALPEFLPWGCQVLAVVDPFRPDQLDRVHRLLAGYRECGYVSRFSVLPATASEHTKTMEQANRVVRAAEGLGLGATDRIIVFAGGTVMDVVGYAAYLYRQDTPYIRVPTTLVGMIDAGIGLKVGVNVNGHKNLLGAYHPPLACLCDMSFLSTLSIKDIQCGLAEAIKIGAVCDARLFSLIAEHHADVLAARETGTVRQILDRSIAAMLNQLSANPFEETLRRLPDFGHEFGHALESLSGYRLRHGVAVGIGMALSSGLAVRTGHLERQEYERLLTLLTQCELALFDPVCEPEVLWRRLTDEVVPHKAGRLHLVVPCRMGEGGFIDSIEEISVEMLRDTCDELGQRALRQRAPEVSHD